MNKKSFIGINYEIFVNAHVSLRTLAFCFDVSQNALCLPICLHWLALPVMLSGNHIGKGSEKQLIFQLKSD